ncbi:hypothetical protein Misp01_33810 [Microtetraspora sp. NBRC 13810]|uniref:sirohydrochlorin chelatase n=1 Tax=Microtetraspora sp. NBRC 13810 TaxID=3030990 RepID=UPI0024A2BE04|nr:CbiX/SirB N-terminal domain-containing protein [Microtetraspora sp. NBRC 13810]GLW08251.1 hypothetical protein Misp01_33810 [Microtetraspora sp. NBRC 13810]
MTPRPTLVMAAHGTRRRQGEEVLCGLRDLVRRARPGHRVELAYLEISSPGLAGTLAALDGPVVVVPMLLAGGYHVHVDLPAVLAATRPDAAVARPLGPHHLLTGLLARRLGRAGLRATDAVILGAAGSSDAGALADVRAAARLLSVRLSRPVTAAFAAAGTPKLGETLDRLRSGPAPRVAVASYLLAPGHFQDRLLECGADLVAEPLGADPGLAELVWTRFDEATSHAVSHTVAGAVAGVAAGSGALRGGLQAQLPDDLLGPLVA